MKYLLTGIAVLLAAIAFYWAITHRPLPVDLVYTGSLEEARQQAAKDTEITVAGSPLVGVITSDSMRPYMAAGKGFFSLEATPFHLIEEGDVVLYWSPIDPQRKVSHFVHRVNRDGSLTTKGSNNKNPDPFLVTEKEYIAKVKTIFMCE